MFMLKSTCQKEIKIITDNFKKEINRIGLEFGKELAKESDDHTDNVASLTDNYNSLLAKQLLDNKNLLDDNNRLLDTLVLALEELDKTEDLRKDVKIPKRHVTEVTEVKLKSYYASSAPNAAKQVQAIKMLEDFLEENSGDFTGTGAVTVLEGGEVSTIKLNSRKEIEEVVANAKSGKIELVL